MQIPFVTPAAAVGPVPSGMVPGVVPSSADSFARLFEKGSAVDRIVPQTWPDWADPAKEVAADVAADGAVGPDSVAPDPNDDVLAFAIALALPSVGAVPLANEVTLDHAAKVMGDGPAAARLGLPGKPAPMPLLADDESKIGQSRIADTVNWPIRLVDQGVQDETGQDASITHSPNLIAQPRVMTTAVPLSGALVSLGAATEERAGCGLEKVEGQAPGAAPPLGGHVDAIAPFKTVPVPPFAQAMGPARNAAVGPSTPAVIAMVQGSPALPQDDGAIATGRDSVDVRGFAAAPSDRSASARATAPTFDAATARISDQQGPVPSLFDRMGGNPGVALSGMTPDTIIGTAVPVDAVVQRPQTPLLAQHVAQQLAVSLRQSSDRVTEMALDPVELGKVRMTVRVQDQAIVMTVVADRPETADLMRRHVDVLQQEFRALGYTSVTLDFSAGQGQSGFGQAGWAGSDRDGPRSSDTPSNSLDAAQAAPSVSARGADGSLDVRL